MRQDLSEVSWPVKVAGPGPLPPVPQDRCWGCEAGHLAEMLYGDDQFVCMGERVGGYGFAESVMLQDISHFPVATVPGFSER